MRILKRYTVGIFFSALMLASPAPAGRPQDQPQQDQQQQNQTEQRNQQDQTQQDQQKKKKKGGFFGGMKKITGVESTEETSATASGGSKSVGEGAKIANATPTNADRQAVSAMEKYSVPEAALKKFQKDGNLQPKQ